MPTRIEVDESINELISKTSSTDRITDTEHREANKQMLDYVDQEVASVGGGGGGSSTFAGLTDAATANIPAINTPTANALTAAKARTNHTGTQNASTISGGTLDGDVLPAISSSKKGGVPATGTPSGKFLKDDNTWAVPATGIGSVAWGAITGTLSTQTDLNSALAAKQATLVSGTNIKTVNGNSILGSGNLAISSGTAVLRDFVEDFGAVEGADNTALLNSIMAMDCTQFILFMPGGTFIANDVVLNRHLNIVGTGLNTGVGTGPTVQVYGAILKSTTASPVFRLAAETPTVTWYPGRIVGIQFDGDNVGTSGFEMNKVQAGNIASCGFQKFTEAAIKIHGSLGCNIDECTFFNNSRDIDLALAYGMPPNLNTITRCRFFDATDWSIHASGGLSMLIMDKCNWERCGTIDDPDTGTINFEEGFEGIGLILRDSYIEGSKGFATIRIGAANGPDVQYVISGVQMNAQNPSPADHDIYIDANGANRQRVEIANSLVRNAGGLTVSGTNASLKIDRSNIPVRTIPAGVEVIEIDENGTILKNGVDVSSILPSYNDLQVADFDTQKRIFWNSDLNLLQMWDGSAQFDITVTPYIPPSLFPFSTDFEGETVLAAPAGFSSTAGMVVTNNGLLQGTNELRMQGGPTLSYSVISGGNAPLACVVEVDFDFLNNGIELSGPMQRANSLTAGSITDNYVFSLRPVNTAVELVVFIGGVPTVIDTVSLTFSAPEKYHLYYSIDGSNNHICRVHRLSDGKYLTDVGGVGTWATTTPADLFNLVDTTITTAGGAGLMHVAAGGATAYADSFTAT